MLFRQGSDEEMGRGRIECVFEIAEGQSDRGDGREPTEDTSTRDREFRGHDRIGAKVNQRHCGPHSSLGGMIAA